MVVLRIFVPVRVTGGFLFVGGERQRGHHRVFLLLVEVGVCPRVVPAAVGDDDVGAFELGHVPGDGLEGVGVDVSL